MKKLLLITMALCGVASASSQNIARAGVYCAADGETVVGVPKSTVEVELRIAERSFTPGVYARYAQKYLGVRAPLTSHVETSILSASVALADSAPVRVCVPQPNDDAAVETSPLPSNRMNGRAVSPEEQASATADMIFSLRKHRMDLITGESGENVFGAGLSSALDEIARLEKEYLEMFYGSTVVDERTVRFLVVPSRGERNYILCRYRDGAGVLPLSDLSGEAVMLHIEPSAEPNTDGLPIADAKDKNKVEYVVANVAKCTLLCGTRELAEISLPIYQYGERVSLAAPAR